MNIGQSPDASKCKILSIPNEPGRRVRELRLKEGGENPIGEVAVRTSTAEVNSAIRQDSASPIPAEGCG